MGLGGVGSYRRDEFKGRYRFPAESDNDSYLFQYRNRHFNFEAIYRCIHMERMARNIYYWLGSQWIELDTENIQDEVRGYIMRDIANRSEQEIPRPVTNYIAPAVEVEQAALTRRKLVPKVISRDYTNPKSVAAAEVATGVLDNRLSSLMWPEIRQEFCLDLAVCGTAILKSFWDAPITETTRIASPDAVMCPQCNEVYASASVPPDEAGPMQANILGVEEGGPHMEACPDCGEKLTGAGNAISIEDAHNKKDRWGRALGTDVPKGNTGVELVPAFDAFPYNSGISSGNPHAPKSMGQASVRSLDWLEERYPEYRGKIFPDNPEELMRYHPILGDWTMLGRYNGTLDSAIYEDHARVYELYAEPSLDNPDGFYYVSTVNQILDSGPLFQTVQLPGKAPVRVPLVKYASARYKTRRGEYWGQALVDYLVSPQNRVNGGDSQVIEARERMGSPNLLTSEGMELEGPEWNDSYGGGKIMTFIRDPMAPMDAPRPFGGDLFPSAYYQERDRNIADMKELAGPQAIEIGEAPKNVSTTSGLQYLGEQADRRRGSREESMIEAFKSIWEHQLQLVWSKRVEPDNFEIETPDGHWERKAFTGSDLMGETRIKIEKQAFVDQSIYQREATREAQADGLYRLDSPLAIKKILELRGLPTDVNENMNRQVEVAQRQWSSFFEDGEPPRIDKTLDDPGVHFEVLGTFLLTEPGQRLSKAIGWQQINQMLGRWEDKVQMLIQQDAAARAFYGGKIEGPEAQQQFGKAMQQYEQDKQAFIAEQGAVATGEATPTMMPPQMPPQPIFAPDALEDIIMQIWTQTLESSGILEQTEGPGAVRANYLRFRAVLEAYKMMSGMGAPGQPQMQQPVDPRAAEFNSGPQPPNAPTPPADPATAAMQSPGGAGQV